MVHSFPVQQASVIKTISEALLTPIKSECTRAIMRIGSAYDHACQSSDGKVVGPGASEIWAGENGTQRILVRGLSERLAYLCHSPMHMPGAQLTPSQVWGHP